jgi:hypothetical protein
MCMRNLLFCMIFLGWAMAGQSQGKSYDTLAIVVLDHMSAIIGDLTSCHFTLTSETDKTDPNLGAVTEHNVSQVWFSGPNKLLIEARGDKGHRGYWYNGKTLTWYSFTDNNYAVIPVPATTMAMIDSVNDTYGIDFPAADFFYPALSDNLIRNSDQISFLGKTTIGDQGCFQVVAKNKNMTVQIWVSDEVFFLPVKTVITYYGSSPDRRYEGTFSGWQVNPSLPDEVFEFALPPHSNEITILPRK